MAYPIFSRRRSAPGPRQVALAIIIVTLAVALAGCGRGTTAAGAVKGGGGELRVAVHGEPTSFEPDLGNDEIASLVGRNIFNQLLSMDVDGRILADLAMRWSVSPDGREYTFVLRQGVSWHDGRPFSADDVRWTFEWLAADPKAYAGDLARRIAAIETPDRHTVVMRLAEPWAPFVPMLAGYGTYVLPRHVYGGGERPARARPVGTGPFRLVEWSRGRRIALAANPAYFGRGPRVDRIVYRIVRDADTAVAALLAGEADVILARPALDRLAELHRSPLVKVDVRPSDARYYAGFNLRRPPFDDPRVRTAINMAIDRVELVDRALSGYGAPALGFYTPDVAWAYDGRARVPDFDPEGAERLLDEAGLSRRGPGGVRLRLDLVGPDRSPIPEITEVLAEQLDRIGVEARRVLEDQPTWVARLLSAHDFDLGVIGGSHGPDPDTLRLRFGSTGPTQFMGYRNPELDTVLASGAAGASLAERARAYSRAQRILARDLPVVPLAEAVRVTLYATRVRGLPQMEARGLVPSGDFSLVRLDDAGAAGGER